MCLCRFNGYSLLHPGNSGNCGVHCGNCLGTRRLQGDSKLEGMYAIICNSEGVLGRQDRLQVGTGKAYGAAVSSRGVSVGIQGGNRDAASGAGSTR